MPMVPSPELSVVSTAEALELEVSASEVLVESSGDGSLDDDVLASAIAVVDSSAVTAVGELQPTEPTTTLAARA
jgi:hypothetical protein